MIRVVVQTFGDFPITFSFANCPERFVSPWFVTTSVTRIMV